MSECNWRWEHGIGEEEEEERELMECTMTVRDKAQ